jgi:hypothetical protein
VKQELLIIKLYIVVRSFTSPFFRINKDVYGYVRTSGGQQWGIYGKNQSLKKGLNFTGQKMTYKKTYFF